MEDEQRVRLFFTGSVGRNRDILVTALEQKGMDSAAQNAEQHDWVDPLDITLTVATIQALKSNVALQINIQNL